MQHKLGMGGLGKEQEDVVSHSVDLFRYPSQEIAFRSGMDVTVQSTWPINQTGLKEFIIQPDGRSFILMSSIRLEGSFRVYNADGTRLTLDTAAVPAQGGAAAVPAQPMAEEDYVSLVNLSPAALFSNCHAYVNKVRVTDGSIKNAFPYFSYLTKQLSYGEDAKSTHLELAGYIEDEEGNAAATGRDSNSAIKIRGKNIYGSRVYDFSTNLDIDLFNVERLMHCSAELKIELERGSDDFVLLTKENRNGEFKIELVSLYLSFRRVELTDAAFDAIQKKYMSNTLVYPIIRSPINKFDIPPNQSNASIVIQRGRIPHFFLFGMVRAAASEGATNLNPFYFDHFNINFVNVKVNGVSIPTTPFKPNFGRGQYSREIRAFYDNVGVGYGNYGNITPARWRDGNIFFAYDLSPDRCFGTHIHDQHEGLLELELGFSRPLIHHVNVITFSSFNDLLTIGHDGTTLTTF